MDWTKNGRLREKAASFIFSVYEPEVAFGRPRISIPPDA
jgi:hypothetical protein